MIGAVVGEWIGATQGIGAMIIQATYNFDSPLLYAAIVMSAMPVGRVLPGSSRCERWIIRWQPEGHALNDLKGATPAAAASRRISFRRPL